MNRNRRESRTLTYSDLWWRQFRDYFFTRLVDCGMAPICGAALPGGPDAAHLSTCLRDGLVTGMSGDGTGLHLHHEPELTVAEQADRSIVCDERRIVLLCRECHARETSRRSPRGAGL